MTKQHLIQGGITIVAVIAALAIYGKLLKSKIEK